MKKYIIIQILALVVPISMMAGKSIPTAFDERVDLMSILWRMAGAREYNMCEISPYISEIDSVFAPYANHKAVRLARRYYTRQHVGYDAVPAFALTLKITQDGQLTTDDAVDDDLDDRWTPEMQKEFMKALTDFHKKSRFHEWYVTNRPFQEMCLEAFRKNVDVDVAWYEQSFGRNADFSIIVSPISGSSNYGMSKKMKNGGFYLSPVISCAHFMDGHVTYSKDSVLPIIIHEFSHAFCNPIIDSLYAQIAPTAESVFSINRDILSRQAYTSAQTMMYETLVRAATIRYFIEHDNLAESKIRELIDNEEEGGFMLVNTILKAWKEKPSPHISLPVEAINSFSLEQYKADKHEADMKKVQYALNITDGQTLPVGEYTMTITFDRPMTKKISLGETSNPFPKFKSYSWSDDACTLSVVFTLEPSQTYGIRVMGNHFVSQDGVKAVDRTVTFRTE